MTNDHLKLLRYLAAHSDLDNLPFEVVELRAEVRELRARVARCEGGTSADLRRLLITLRELHADGALSDCYNIEAHKPLGDAVNAWALEGYPGAEVSDD